jgi:quercetin dioxygenase-like cupin family protein
MAVNRSRLLQVVVVVVLLVLPSSLILHAQQAGAPSDAPSPKRTVLDKHDLSVPDHEGVLVLTEFPPGAREPRHTHPADLYAYIQEGTLNLTREGEPDVTLKAGDFFFVKAGQVHWGINNGSTPVKIVVTFFAEKGKPLTTPVK